MEKPSLLVYPHQLYQGTFDSFDKVFLIEDPLYYKQYNFCFQKLLLHRASMKNFEHSLQQQGADVHYIEHTALEESGDIAKVLLEASITHCCVYEFDDDWLERRVTTAMTESAINLTVLVSPGFLTDLSWSRDFFEKKGRYFFTEYYIAQRKRLNLLLDAEGPIGGKWSFDHENRKKIPKTLIPPAISAPIEDAFTREARAYIDLHFPNAPGERCSLLYPHTHASARAWLREFIDYRFSYFGDYEDAILSTHKTLFHSILTPTLNIGLLSPQEILDAVLSAKTIGLNSLEGFVRQLVGWREFMRAMYHIHGREQRTSNFFANKAPMPLALYDGTTGIPPIDITIQSVLATGYCHHIERLMLLGNFMLLCNIDPKAIYQWFMELFVDSYDWVMVPNVYSMSQYADGGKMTTKPYISGSSYVLKMSDYKKGDWCATWDALYWTHIAKHKKFYASNHRMSMMAAMSDKLGAKLVDHQQNAAKFLDTLFAR